MINSAILPNVALSPIRAGRDSGPMTGSTDSAVGWAGTRALYDITEAARRDSSKRDAASRVASRRASPAPDRATRVSRDDAGRSRCNGDAAGGPRGHVGVSPSIFTWRSARMDRAESHALPGARLRAVAADP